ncbi:helix-hairpin-helix domain-containing protein [Oceanobacillus piezotolerans]|nr:helix-hairpin-helix domain-containing protein [Oceanobacillus piezotolerans]
MTEQEVDFPSDIPQDELQSENSPINEDTVLVDVKGEVVNKGVYQVNSNARVNDVISKAGGFTAKADETQVNLAQRVQDEMVIFIPEKGEGTQQIMEGASSTGTDKIRINYATQEEVEKLSGIGPSKAAAIIEHREEHGFFQTADDLLEITGIGEKTVENIKEEIQVP